MIALIIRALEESLDRDPDHMFQFSVKRDRVIDETESGIIPQMDSQKVHIINTGVTYMSHVYTSSVARTVYMYIHM